MDYTSGFNEARASLPGKARRLGEDLPVKWTASMRPGQVCPGKQAIPTTSGRISPGFNEARASLPGKGQPTG